MPLDVTWKSNSHIPPFINSSIGMASPPDVQETVEKIRKTWINSQLCADLQSSLQAARPQCNKVVGFALASHTRRKTYDRYAYQHMLLLTLRDFFAAQLEIPDPSDVPVYAQEITYTELDRSLLAGYGITAVMDPGGFLQIDDSSAVVSISPDAPIKSVVLDIARPALIIWNEVQPESESVSQSS